MPRIKARKPIYDPRDFHLPTGQENKISPEEWEEMRTLVFRRWPPFLTGAQFKIVLHIYDRTIMYNRRWSYVSIATLEHGYPHSQWRRFVNRVDEIGPYASIKTLTPTEKALIEDGQHILTPGTGLSRRQIVRSLQELIIKGFVHRIVESHDSYCALDPTARYSYLDWMEKHYGSKKRKKTTPSRG